MNQIKCPSKQTNKRNVCWCGALILLLTGNTIAVDVLRGVFSSQQRRRELHLAVPKSEHKIPNIFFHDTQRIPQTHKTKDKDRFKQKDKKIDALITKAPKSSPKSTTASKSAKQVKASRTKEPSTSSTNNRTESSTAPSSSSAAAVNLFDTGSLNIEEMSPPVTTSNVFVAQNKGSGVVLPTATTTTTSVLNRKGSGSGRQRASGTGQKGGTGYGSGSGRRPQPRPGPKSAKTGGKGTMGVKGGDKAKKGGKGMNKGGKGMMRCRGMGMMRKHCMMRMGMMKKHRTPAPSSTPTKMPTLVPTGTPTRVPTENPTPTGQTPSLPTSVPAPTASPITTEPTMTMMPTTTPYPSQHPTTFEPTLMPTSPSGEQPTASPIPPGGQPTPTPGQPTSPPAEQPTPTPGQPTKSPAPSFGVPTPTPGQPTKSPSPSFGLPTPTPGQPTLTPGQFTSSPATLPPTAGIPVQGSNVCVDYTIQSTTVPNPGQYQQASQVTCSHVESFINSTLSLGGIIVVSFDCSQLTTSDSLPPQICFGITVVLAQDTDPDQILDTGNVDDLVFAALSAPAVESLISDLQAQLPNGNPLQGTTAISFQTQASAAAVTSTRVKEKSEREAIPHTTQTTFTSVSAILLLLSSCVLFLAAMIRCSDCNGRGGANYAVQGSAHNERLWHCQGYPKLIHEDYNDKSDVERLLSGMTERTTKVSGSRSISCRSNKSNGYSRSASSLLKGNSHRSDPAP